MQTRGLWNLSKILWMCSLISLGFGFTSNRNARRISILEAKSRSLLSSARPSPVNKERQGMTMHMGHSHAHHDHEHNPDNVVVGALRKKRRRRLASVFFAALASLGLPVVQRRAVNRTDMALFVVISAVLTLSEKIKREVNNTIRTIRGFRDGIAKHAPSDVSPGKWIQYLFKNENAADQVTLFGGVINLFLSLGKFVVGITCHSSALIADAGHSLSDLFSDVITLWAVQMGRLPPDDDHPYGHGKFEAIGSLFLALTLLGTGISVGAVSNKKLIEIIAVQRAGGWTSEAAASLAAQVPTAPALFMAGLSIVSKEWLYRITRQVGEKLNSQVVIANAWHHRSDAYSSVLALLAIGLAMFFPALIAADSAAGILVAGMICMTGAEIMGESIKQLTDTTNEALVKKVKFLAQQNADDKDDYEVKRVRARQVGSQAIVDVSIAIPGDLPSSASRMIAERVRQIIFLDTADDVIDVEVHVITKEEVPALLTITEEGSSDPPVSPSEIEEDVRKEIDLRHSDYVDSVQGVLVRYDTDADALTPSVDVMIRIDPEATVAAANKIAGDVRGSLENLDQIHKASIFLDLNAKLPLQTKNETSVL